MRRVSTIIAGLFVVSLAASPMLWAAGTGGTSGSTGGTGSGTIERLRRGTGETGGTGTSPTIERPGRPPCHTLNISL
jgi:hypothetical protein